MQKRKLLILNLILVSVLLACFFAMLILVVCEYNFKMDILNAEIIKLRTPVLNWFFIIFSYLGNFFVLSLIVLLIFLVLFFKFKHKYLSWFIVLCFALVSVVNFLIKNVVRRIRPEFMLFEEFSYSFPSWHAMLTCFVFGVLIYFAYKFIKNKPLKIVLITIFSLIIVLMAFARVYLGVHYLSDVVAGLLLGLSFVFMFVLLYNLYFATKKD